VKNKKFKHNFQLMRGGNRYLLDSNIKIDLEHNILENVNVNAENVDVKNVDVILSTLRMEMTPSSETSALTKPTQRYIQEQDILHSHLCENLNPVQYVYMV
jgi:hypothetical protein